MKPVADKIYFRGADTDGSDSLSKIAQRIAPGSVVLDLGCGPGALGTRLAADKRCTIDGVEASAKAAALARRALSQRRRRRSGDGRVGDAPR